jgi:hypothetical protein
VNLELASYAFDRLDLAPSFCLECTKVYGQGVWAPCIRHHKVGISHTGETPALERFDQTNSQTVRQPIGGNSFWFRAECDYDKEKATLL